MLLNFWKKLLRVCQNHHTSETHRLGGKKRREYSICSSPPVYRWELPTLQRQSSYLLFWLLHSILKSHSLKSFYIIKYYQCLWLIKLTKLATSEQQKRSYFILKSSNPPEPMKKWSGFSLFRNNNIWEKPYTLHCWQVYLPLSLMKSPS